MPTYYYPEMPLKANVWYQAPTFPPEGPPDDLDVACSLSPTTVSQAVQLQSEAAFSYVATHIIRTATNLRVADNFTGPTALETLPATIWEVPPGSGHFYYTFWGHVVGAGFPNEHSRVYVTRIADVRNTQPPYFVGYI